VDCNAAIPVTWTTETIVYGVNNRGAEVGPERLADQSRSAVHLREVYNVYTPPGELGVV
jgi:hypothetical protein